VTGPLLADAGMTARTVVGRDAQSVLAIRQQTLCAQVVADAKFWWHTMCPSRDKLCDKNTEEMCQAGVIATAFISRTRVAVLTGNHLYVSSQMHSPLQLVSVAEITSGIDLAAAADLLFVLQADGLHAMGTRPGMTTLCVGSANLFDLKRIAQDLGIDLPRGIIKPGLQYLIHAKLNSADGAEPPRLLPAMMNEAELDILLHAYQAPFQCASAIGKRAMLGPLMEITPAELAAVKASVAVTRAAEKLTHIPGVEFTGTPIALDARRCGSHEAVVAVLTKDMLVCFIVTTVHHKLEVTFSSKLKLSAIDWSDCAVTLDFPGYPGPGVLHAMLIRWSAICSP